MVRKLPRNLKQNKMSLSRDRYVEKPLSGLKGKQPSTTLFSKQLNKQEK